MTTYRRRTLDSVLDTYQPQLPAVELYGARGVGKTATAAQRAASSLRLDRSADAERLRADPSLLTALPAPVLVDEWSRVPESWDLVRRAVDDGAPAGRYLLTGSADVPKGVIVHSGAGRIARFRMRPLSLAERAIEQPTVSLSRLLAGEGSASGQTDVGLADYVQEIVGSGFPGIRSRPAVARTVLLDSYLDEVVTKEFPEQGYAVRRPQVLRDWLGAYAAATATTASYNRIMEASTPGVAPKPSKGATSAYRDALASLWLLDPVPAWLPTHNRLERAAQTPKHFLADPALACRLLHVGERQLLAGDQGARGTELREGTLLGALFEHLSALSVLVYAQAARADVHHLRTHSGDHEIDLIVTSDGGGVFGIEVKLTQAPDDRDVRHLVWLRDRIGSDCLGGMVLTTGTHAYARRDGILVVPLALLGP